MSRLAWKIDSFGVANDDPSTVMTRVGYFRIVVTRRIGEDPGKWFLRWDADDLFELQARELEQAKIEALRRVKAKISEAMSVLGLETL